MKSFRYPAYTASIIWLCALLVLQTGLAHHQAWLSHTAHTDTALVVAVHHQHLPCPGPDLPDRTGSSEDWPHVACAVGAACCGFWVAGTENLEMAVCQEKPSSITPLPAVDLQVHDPPPKGSNA